MIIHNTLFLIFFCIWINLFLVCLFIFFILFFLSDKRTSVKIQNFVKYFTALLQTVKTI